MLKENKICKLFGVEIPIVQAGMVWCSGWRLASAVSNAGALGLIGSGSMYPDILAEHIRKCRDNTDKPFGVNVPLLYPHVEQLLEVILEQEVKIVFTSAGNPATWTSKLKEKGVTVVHVVSSVKFAIKAEQAGVDAVVAEGFEAGGHNGRDETTTMVLIPTVREAINIPLLAAGGIASGRAMLAAQILGANGVQIGSRFAASEESSAHQNFKMKVVKSKEGETMLTLKKLAPVRMIKNRFFEKIKEAEARGASEAELREILGKQRSKRGIFEGDLDEGELEIGQVSAGIDSIMPASAIVSEIWTEYRREKAKLCYDNS